MHLLVLISIPSQAFVFSGSWDSRFDKDHAHKHLVALADRVAAQYESTPCEDPDKGRDISLVRGLVSQAVICKELFAIDSAACFSIHGLRLLLLLSNTVFHYSLLCYSAESRFDFCHPDFSFPISSQDPPCLLDKADPICPHQAQAEYGNVNLSVPKRQA